MSDNFVGKRILQPKKEIMSYLALKGIRVPEIDVTRKGIWRSEHPQDYEGSSDLFPNGDLEELLEKSDNITSAIMSQDRPHIRKAKEEIHLHCELLGLNYEEFMKDLSHSAWERIMGTNRVIYADSAIDNKYHIITLSPVSYDIIENGKTRQMTDRSHSSISTKEASGLIKTYEQIRQIMDPDHCYIIETQTTQNHQSNTHDHFAVQVHRGIDNQKANFKAEPKGWDSINFYDVRGATTSPEGEDLLLTLSYPYSFRDNPALVSEDASTQASEHYISRVFSEIMFKKRKLHIFPYRDDSDLRYEINNHCSRNSLFKPACSVLAYAPDIQNKLGSKMRQDKLVQVNANFVSDGERAYLDILD